MTATGMLVRDVLQASGYRVVEAERAIPVIAVTASAMTQNRREIMAAGFDGYQAKPISAKGFLQTVRETLPPRSA
jgi:CheY-like chemotaxis protein